MPDIPALKYIEDQKAKIEGLPLVSDLTVNIQKFSTTVEAITKETDELYSRATNYANEILKKIKTVITAIELSHARIADGIRKRMKWIDKEEVKLLKEMEKLINEKKKFYGDTQLDDGDDYSLHKYRDYIDRQFLQNQQYTPLVKTADPKIETNSPKNNKNINGSVMKDILTLQKLALQQNQLMQVMSQLEDVISKLDEDIQISDTELDKVKNLTNDWLKNLENVKDREQRLKKDQDELERKKKELLEKIEQRKREKRIQMEEEERKRREDEERKRQEEEERKRREEERKKQEEERRIWEEEMRKRKEEEMERKKREEEENRKRLEEEERERKRKEEEERERKRKEEEEELERREKEKQEEIERKKREEEREEKNRLAEELRKRTEEDERKRKEEDEKKRLEEERKQKKIKEEKARAIKKAEDRLKRDMEKRNEAIEQRKKTIRQEQERKEARERERKETREQLLQDKHKRDEEKQELEKQRIEREKLENARRREAENLERERRQIEEEKRRIEKERLEKEEAEKKRQDKEKQEEKRRKQREEKQKQLERIEDEIKRKEEEEKKRREAEEEERRKKEEEKNRRIYEEFKKQQEEERKRRDPNNWPKFIYKAKEKDPFGQTLLCVLLAMPNGVQQSDIICERSTSDVDLCLESNVPDEQFLSSLITIKASKNLNKFEMPIQVYMPVKECGDTQRISAVKYSVNGEKFKYGKTLPAINVPGVKEKLVGVETDIRELTSLECVALASFEHETVYLNENANNFELSRDKNIQLKIQQKTFNTPTNCKAKVVPRKSLKQNKQNNAIITGSLLDVTFDHKTKRDIEVTVYGFGMSGSSKSKKEKTDHQKIIERTSDWLVNEMGSDFDESFLEEICGSDFVEEYKAIESDGDKNRSILKRLYNSSRAFFNNFVQKLATKQPEVATKLKNSLSISTSAANMDDIETSSGKNKITELEEAISNVHETRQNKEEKLEKIEIAMVLKRNDFEEIDGTVRIVSKVSGKTWEVVELTDISTTYPRKRMLKLPAGYDNYQLFGLVVTDNMTEAEICEAAAKIELSFFATNISILCRQKQRNQNEVTIECVRTETVSDRIQHLYSLGFTEGPQESAPIPVTDGEEITFTFESNLFLEGRKNSPFKVKFFNNLASENYSGHLTVVDKNDQLEEERYHGYLKYEVLQKRKSFPRTGSMVLYLKKVYFSLRFV